MLILTKDNRPLLVGLDIDAEAAADLVANGDAREVSAVKINRDLAIAKPDGPCGHYEAGATYKLGPGKGEILPEHAKAALTPDQKPSAAFHAFPNAEVA